MANTWELICHHTYAGTPGVVYDRSPPRASHGMAHGLSDGDFLTDGATPGTGSIRFHQGNGVVRIPCTAPAWQSIIGIKGEVTLRREQVAQAFIIDSNAFQLYVRSGALNGWFSSAPAQYAQINSAWDSIAGEPYQVPAGRWVTFGFLHNGFGTLELSADGIVVARKQGAYQPVNAPGGPGVGIGNSLAGGAQLEGEIDEVKIWRLNPHKMDEEFLDRAMDLATAECWRRFRRALAEALARHPDCAQQLAVLLRDAIEAIRRSAQKAGADTQDRLAELQAKYQKLWQAGKVGGPQMAQVFEDFMAVLQAAGVDFKTDPRLLDLANSDCLRRILAGLPSLDCDPKAAKLVQSIVARMGLASAAKA